MKYGNRFLTANTHRALIQVKRHLGCAVRSLVAAMRDLRQAVIWQARGY